jgi:glycosyltransferase involved in cell wall biosynthesis
MVNKKILICSPTPQETGGIARWTRTIFEQLAYSESQGFLLSLLPMNRSKLLTYGDSKFKRIYYGIRDYLFIIVNLIKCLVKIRPDILHINTSGGLSFIKDLLMITLASLFRTKVIVHFHFGRISTLPKYSFERFLIYLTIKLSWRILVLDMDTYKILRKDWPDRIQLVNNPLSERYIDLVKEQKEIVEPEHNLFIFVGHIIETKGIIELINAFMCIPDVKLVLLGRVIDFELKNELEHQLVQKDMQDRIIFKGELDEINVLRYMLKSTALVFPSHTEGFPNVILESMVAGCPIITTRVGAIPDILEFDSDKQLATEILVGNVNSIVTAIGNLIENNEVSLMKAELARLKAIKEFSSKRVLDSLFNIYNSI